MKNIVIFASGSGTNAQNITEYFAKSNLARVVLIVSNKPDAYVLQKAKLLHIPTQVFNRTRFYDTREILQVLHEYKCDIIVLAGFLWLLPEWLIEAYNHRILNIHPALLPKYGGKGMYGNNVHKAVVENHETETGITIHLVNKEYDKGKIIFQAKTPVHQNSTVEDVAESVHKLEYQYYPQVIEQFILSFV